MRLYTVEDIAFYQQIRHLFAAERPYKITRLYDRIDIHIEVDAVPIEEITEQKAGESSKVVRERVENARRLQQKRFASAGIACNAQMNNKHVEELAALSDPAKALLARAVERYALSMRGYTRLIKVARTIADIEGSEQLQPSHLAEAISYRNLDRSDWAERGV